MVQVRPRCGAGHGGRAPFENTSKTHGLCGPCFQTEMFQIAAEGVARAIEAEPCVPLLRKFLAVADAAWERSGLFAGGLINSNPPETTQRTSGELAK